MLEAETLAARHNVTLKNLIEQGLRLALEKRLKDPVPSIRPVTIKGEGLSEDFQIDGWKSVRSAAYEGRGG